MTGTTSEFWWSTLSSQLSIGCAIAAVVLVIVAAQCVVVMIRCGRSTRRPVRLWADNNGTATIEFALTLPVLLFVVLMLAQITMLMGGNLFVHYAAFAAVRTAIVQIPLNVDDGPNTYTPGGTKAEAILRSAVFAIVPAAGRADSAGNSNIPVGQYVDAVSSFYSSYGQSPPPWIESLLRQRLNYASANTTITVLRPRIIDDVVVFENLDGNVQQADPITVRVNHKLNLGVPYINRIFADGNLGNNVRYTEVIAMATLTNEGITDEFPPLPVVPRTP